ncbi:DUF2270 domain-containing protein [Actinoplanes sp. LDG1-06]|uniref:DUF2270 domain-containing protein n=1 Tax=Paractinoplanes ovalisporus TaxID=2810368 RepID=A0ABS2A705_9ACTN|nr:DUF2270 domain-containing protein [Actinoplanes ovalisporus]MBM2615622.1 DUF2270 domain-containing protein [Actinoplanes ovalisporus]
MPTAFEVRLENLRKEYEYTETAIRTYDDHAFKVKNWAITVCSAVTLIAINSHRPVMYLVGVVAALGFWVMDAYTRLTQRIFIRRNRAMERFFHGPALDEAFEAQSLNGIDVPLLSDVMGKVPRSALARQILFEARMFPTYYLYVALLTLMIALFVADLA